jgi:glutamyl/glutaminyl-tRNA synthetase
VVTAVQGNFSRYREHPVVGFDDIVYGTIEKSLRDIEDSVIVRSDGMPLYLLSNAVDDPRDRITHVIRGSVEFWTLRYRAGWAGHPCRAVGSRQN